MKKNNSFMMAAVEEARAGVNDGDGGPFGAVVVHQDQVVGRGHNMVVKTNDPTAHAEVVAIREASQSLDRFDLSDCVLYTTCEPCPMCLAAVLWARIKTVIYGCSRQDAAEIGFDDNHFYDVVAGKTTDNAPELLQQERDPCLKLFHKWQYSKTKTFY